MATTTNYGWTTPDDTALVKDGAAAIRTLGSSVDTTTKNLNPSTTLGDIEYRSSTANTNTRVGIGSSGQALTVVAGVPSWAASATSVLTTTGDTLYASAANTLARRAIGSTGDVLTVAGGLPTWAAPAGGGSLTLLSTTSLSGAIVTLSSISQSYQHLYLVIDKFTNLTSNGQLIIKPNASANVQMSGQRNNGGNAAVDIQTNTAVNCGWNTNRTNADNTAGLFIYDYTTSTRHKRLSYINGGVDGAGGNSAAHQQGVIMADAAITSITIESNGGDLNGGTAYLYGVK